MAPSQIQQSAAPVEIAIVLVCLIVAALILLKTATPIEMPPAIDDTYYSPVAPPPLNAPQDPPSGN
jgi:hypothetical protein